MTSSGRRQIRVVGLGGSTRDGSTAEKALGVALQAARRRGAEVELLSGPDLDLPFYSGSSMRRSKAAQRLVAAVADADGLVIATPAYHGGMSGLVKNALDYLEELRDRPEPYLSGRAVGCVATAQGWQAGSAALDTLRGVAHALRGWPTPLGVAVNTATARFDHLGRFEDPRVHHQLVTVGDQVVDFARMRDAWRHEEARRLDGATDDSGRVDHAALKPPGADLSAPE